MLSDRSTFKVVEVPREKVTSALSAVGGLEERPDGPRDRPPTPSTKRETEATLREIKRNASSMPQRVTGDENENAR